jgi:hypothetical protein
MLAFGTQPRGTTSALRTVIVSNPGTGDLHVSSVALGGANPGDFQKSADACSGSTVAPGGTCSVGVRFGPGAPGDRSGTIGVASDAVGKPTAQVPLTGQGVKTFDVWFAEPTRLMNQLALPLHVWTAGMSAAPTAVQLRPTGGGAITPLSFTPGSGGRIDVSLTPGLAGGSYDVLVTQTGGEVEELDGTLQLSGGGGTLGMTAVIPNVASSSTATTASVIASTTPPSPGFTVSPRTYLLPTKLTFGTATAFTVTGSNFSTPTLRLLCRDRAGGAFPEAFPTVSSWTATSISATVTTPSATPPATARTCVLKVSNQDDGYAYFNPRMTIQYPCCPVDMSVDSSVAGSRAVPLANARRGLALVDGVPDPAGIGDLYAIGGDNGTVAGASSGVQSAAVDSDGFLQGFSSQRNSLPQVRTLLGAARVGRFIYAVGGNGGSGAVATVSRAQILDAGAAPLITGHTLSLGGAPTSFSAGGWMYQVAALFPASDASNPSGESLPSFPEVVQLPDNANERVTLNWTAVPGASGYRIYRTVSPGGSMQQLTDVSGGPTTSHTDIGAATTATTTPLPPRSLGVWAPLTSMATAREGAAVTAARDPADQTKYYLYAAGGRNASSTVLSSYEYLPITLAADGSQTIGTWTAGASAIGTARWKLTGFAVGRAQASFVPAATTYVYFAGGEAGAGTPSTGVVAGTVAAGGDLGTLNAVSSPCCSADRSGSDGAGAAALNGYVMLLGGGPSGPSAATGGFQAWICQSAGTPDGACAGGPPALGLWNELVGYDAGLVVPRHLFGVAVDRGVIYAAGGATNTTGNNATSTTEAMIG